MIPMPSNVRVWLANGHSDMRRGMNGLALQVQQALDRDPHAGDLYVFRGQLNDIDPRAWLADVLRRINDHPASRLHELLPWNWARTLERRNLAA